MAKENSMDDAEQVLRNVVSQMKTFTAPSITQVCGNRTSNEGELVGTGTLIRLRGADYLLTAQHVAHKMYKQNIDGSRKYPEGLSHSVGSGQLMVNIRAPWITWNSPHDLAVTRLETDVLVGTDCVPLNVDHIALNSKSLSDRDIFCIHGFPVAQSRPTSFFGGGVLSRSLPYGGWMQRSTWSGFDENIHFAISFPPNDITNERSETTNLPLAHGISGSVVWKTNKEGTGSEWTPELARVVGVAHRFDQESRCLVVTRIECVKGLLLYTLRSDFAYSRWLTRGKPLGDDLDDWIAAEQAIRDLR
jgi:hypothetical protein